MRKKHEVCIFKALISKHSILTSLYSQVCIIVKHFMGYYYVFCHSTLRRPIIGTSLSKFRHSNKLQQVKWAQNNSKFDFTALDLVRSFQQIKEEFYREIKISRCVKDRGKQSDKVMPFLSHHYCNVSVHSSLLWKVTALLHTVIYFIKRKVCARHFVLF